MSREEQPPRQAGITPEEPQPDVSDEEAPWRRRLATLSSQITNGAAQRVSTLSSAISKLTNGQGQTPMVIHPEVARALKDHRAVVALESTIISHGMPYPQNLQTALEVEEVVRQGGAVPATIAVLAGVPHVGLTHEQLEHIARRGQQVRKTSRRDLPVVMGARLDGATTVSATMLCAARAGIPIFVTGGIGGVHRGADSSMDISADLTELGRTPVAVVCAGVKSILDIPRTLEVLETQGVCVAAYGADDFPAFFSARSGCAAPARVDTPGQAAALVRSALELRLDSGILIGVPIPGADAAEGAVVERAMGRALKEADSKGLKGAAITPFLLDRIQQLTGGASLAANIRLVKNNARVGAAIAVTLAKPPDQQPLER